MVVKGLDYKAPQIPSFFRSQLPFKLWINYGFLSFFSVVSVVCVYADGDCAFISQTRIITHINYINYNTAQCLRLLAG